MKSMLLRVIGIAIAILGVVIIIFCGIQTHFMDTQQHLEYLILNNETMGLCLGLGLGTVFAGLSLYHNS